MNRIVSCLEAIKVFLGEKEEHFPQLNDEDWVLKLMFLTDIMIHMDEFTRIRSNLIYLDTAKDYIETGHFLP